MALHENFYFLKELMSLDAMRERNFCYAYKFILKKIQFGLMQYYQRLYDLSLGNKIIGFLRNSPRMIDNDDAN